jgi:K+-sensing histidine kinase KdpD
MLHMTNHRVRAPLCTSLGLLQLLEEDQGQYAKDRDNIMAHLKENILRLDTFTKELTDFLQQAREKRRGLGS